MANYSKLKEQIASVIRTNGKKEITAVALQGVLSDIVTSLGDGYKYMGVAKTTDNPGTPDGNVYYIATAKGTYTNFGNVTVVSDGVNVIKYDGGWSVENITSCSGKTSTAENDSQGNISGANLGVFNDAGNKLNGYIGMDTFNSLLNAAHGDNSDLLWEEFIVDSVSDNTFDLGERAYEYLANNNKGIKLVGKYSTLYLFPVFNNKEYVDILNYVSFNFTTYKIYTLSNTNTLSILIGGTIPIGYATESNLGGIKLSGESTTKGSGNSLYLGVYMAPYGPYGEQKTYAYLDVDVLKEALPAWNRDDYSLTETGTAAFNGETKGLAARVYITPNKNLEIAIPESVLGEAFAPSLEDMATKDELNAVKKDIDAMKYKTGMYCVGRWESDELTPTPVAVEGDKEFALAWRPYLFDCDRQAEEDGTMRPVGRLMDNNLLRFADGSFAPVVGITEEMRAECDVALYLDREAQQLYCISGEFDAAKFYEEYGDTPLYDSQGEAVRVLKPWETTNKNYSIFIAHDSDLYLIDEVAAASARDNKWRGVCAVPEWDGKDYSEYKLARTGLSPSPVCTVDNKARCFFFLYPLDKCNGSAGQDGLLSVFHDNGAYPRTNDMNQVTTMQRVRANNADTSSPVPFAECGFHALNAFITCAEVGFGTKALHASNMFGSGISSNDSCNNETNWVKNGGVRYKLRDAETWSYGTFSSTPVFCYNESGGKTNWSVLLNLEHPMNRCLEAQMAASYAAEKKVAEDEHFFFYGDEYWYENVNGVTGLNDGRMNTRLYRLIRTEMLAYTADGEQATYDVEVVVRTSLILGMDVAGDVYSYCGGGCELVATCDDNTVMYGHPVSLYLEPDQRKWVSETTVTKSNLGVFDFESQYKHLGDTVTLQDAWSEERFGYSPLSIKRGGNALTGECYYQWSNRYWSSTLNQRVRLALRFRGRAHFALCAPRSLAVNGAASDSYRGHAGSAQVLLAQ